MSKKLLGSIVVSLSLVITPACSTLGGAAADAAAGALMPGKDDGLSVDTELVVGDKEQQVNSDIQSGDRVSGETVTLNKSEVNNISPYILILLVLGWILPTPVRLWKGLTSKFKFWSKK